MRSLRLEFSWRLTAIVVLVHDTSEFSPSWSVRGKHYLDKLLGFLVPIGSRYSNLNSFIILEVSR